MSSPNPVTSYNFELQAAALAGSGSPSPAIVVYNRNPTTTDLGGPSGNYSIGQIWYSLSSLTWWGLQSISAGQATWVDISGSGGSVSQITGNSGSAVASSGNISILGTTNQISSSGSGSTLTLSLSSPMVAPGAITATSGNITATNGNLVLSTAGNKLSIATGSNSSVGTSGAMTAGAVTVSNTSVTASSKIFCYPAALGTVTAPQAYYISAIVANTNFTITSASASDTSTWNYWIIN